MHQPLTADQVREHLEQENLVRKHIRHVTASQIRRDIDSAIEEYIYSKAGIENLEVKHCDVNLLNYDADAPVIPTVIRGLEADGFKVELNHRDVNGVLIHPFLRISWALDKQD